MTSNQFPGQSTPHRSIRTLKIEVDGDFWRRRIKPKIRLRGRWLELAGFSPGNRVQVICVAPGVIELRVPEATLVNGLKQAPPLEPEVPS